MECLNCGKTFRAEPSEINRYRRFCSRKCYRSYPGETLPEQNARLSLDALGERFHQEHKIAGLRKTVDFYLPGRNLVIEIDSPCWHSKTAERDARKDAYLQSLGIGVLRLPAQPFYAKELANEMVRFMERALTISENAVPNSDISSLYPIQYAAPLDLERVI